MIYLEIVSKLLLVIILWVFIFYFGVPFLKGAPFAPSKKNAIKKMIKLADIQSGQKVVDLGSGDGRIVIALAQAGAQAYGYEINRFLVWYSRLRIKLAGLSDQAQIYHKSFWDEDLGQYDTIIVFGVFYIMEKLNKKLDQELKPGTKVVANFYKFPSWTPVQSDNKLYLYKKQ